MHYSKVGDWTEDQFHAVLTANAQSTTWTVTNKPNVQKYHRSWKRTDGARAVWTRNAEMTLTHPAYERAKAIAEAKAKAESSKVPKV